MNHNSSSTHLSKHRKDGLKALCTLLPVAIAIILSNGVVLALISRRKSLRTKSNYMLLSLAICDLLTGAINIPYFILFSFEVVTYILHTLLSVSAAYHILFINAEKYLAIKRPLRHHLVTKKIVFNILLGIWMISTLIAVIPVVWNESSSRLLCYIIHSAICLLVVFFIPYALMIYAFAVMFQMISKRVRPPLRTCSQRSRLQHKNITDRKCVIIFAIIAAIFALCWFPYFAMMLLININDYGKSDTSISIRKATEAFAIIRYTASITNPLLYTYFKRDFWLEIRNSLFKRRFSGSLASRRNILYFKQRPRPVDNNLRCSLSSDARGSNMENDLSTNSKEEVLLFISSVWNNCRGTRPIYEDANCEMHESMDKIITKEISSKF